MGGAKCTYRNCTMKTNGVTHMFHYPVFDKIRCHQWLTNAQRLEFLNLKVSQLKNRVVCQYHFKPDNFMNYKMDKLRYDAVPTENGPFCNAEDWASSDEKILPIGPDEIENDRLSLKEKQANFSTKYGDFLINSELEPIKSTDITYKDLQKIDDEAVELSYKELQQFNTDESLLKPCGRQIEVEVPVLPKIEKSSFIAKKPQDNKKVRILSERKLLTPVTVKGKLEPVPTDLIIYPRPKKPEPIENTKFEENIENMNVIFSNPQENAVDLINSEITFLPPTFLEPQNVQLDQSTVCLPPVNQNYEPNSGFPQIQIINTRSMDNISQPVQMITPLTTNNTQVNTPLTNKNNEITKTNNQTPSKSVLKSKIPAERVAAIEEKRKFNKKLRDMIEFCLDDTPEKATNENSKLKERVKEDIKMKKVVPHQENKQVLSVKNSKNQCNKEKVSSFLSKEPCLPSVSEYDMASLEARLQRMEENLMRKIEKNTQKIGELQDTMKSTTLEKKTAMTQTKEDEDSRKKQLYLEISKFLSPDANSLIYEELFLNKYSKAKVSPTKRRRLR